MHKKKPYITELENLLIRKQGEYAIIDYVAGDAQTVNLHIGSEIHQMSDTEIHHFFVRILEAQEQMRVSFTPIEIPEGRSQIEYSKDTEQWVPRGHVLRCEINDGGEEMETSIIIDNHELSLEEFGGLLKLFNGWGMRIVFVDNDRLTENPIIEVKDPNDEE